MANHKKRVSERAESLLRIIVAIVSGIILSAWSNLIGVLLVVNFLIALITNQRNKGIAEFCEYFNTELYKFCKYITFVTNRRPFPFSNLEKMGKFE